MTSAPARHYRARGVRVKVGKRTRKEASCLLAILASQPESWPWFVEDCPWPCSKAARKLADEARQLDDEVDPDLEWRELYAEAESRLRCGWSTRCYVMDFGVHGRHWIKCKPHQSIWTCCCKRRRIARNLRVQVYYDGSYYSCKPGTGCKRGRR